MQFIKQNIILLIVLLITLVMSGFIFIQTSRMSALIDESIVKRDDAVKKIASAYEKRHPNVNRDNLASIQKDRWILEEKKFNIQQTFGKFYRKAFQEFAAKIETSKKVLVKPKQNPFDKRTPEQRAESDLLTAFAKYYANCPKESKPSFNSTEKDKKAVNDFFMKYFISPDAVAPADPNKPVLLKEEELIRKKIYENALTKFTEDIQDIAIDKVDQTNVYEYLLAAMGIPRSASISIYKGQLSTAKANFISSGLIPRDATDVEISNFTFPDTAMVDQSMIPAYLAELQRRKDLFTRFKKVGIQKIETFKFETSPFGEPIGNKYRKFVYRVSFISVPDMLRKIMLVFGQDALKQNVVYIINEVSIRKTVSEDIAQLMKAAANSNEQKQRIGTETSAQTTTEAANCVIGSSRTVTITLLISMITYTGDELQRSKE